MKRISRETPGMEIESAAGPRLVQLQDIRKVYRSGSMFSGNTVVTALDGVNLYVANNEAFGLVGESGCGKSTLGRIMSALESPSSGSVIYRGIDMKKLSRESRRRMRREIQMVFQNPFGSLNPRMSAFAALSEPIVIHHLAARSQLRDRVAELMELVSLSPDDMNRFPHQFSGGQCQRLAIARALAMHPLLLVADEPVSSLDVSVQAQILNLLLDLHRSFGMALLLISHDLAMVRYVCTRVAVMYLGRIVEMASSEKLFKDTRHPYTRALIAAVPDIDIDSDRTPMYLQGELPSEGWSRCPGCPYEPRCQFAMDKCRSQSPGLVEVSDGHFVACHMING